MSFLSAVMCRVFWEDLIFSFVLLFLFSVYILPRGMEERCRILSTENPVCGIKCSRSNAHFLSVKEKWGPV